jgi:formylglycine-generating enzyme required for sulfatase activity
VVITALGMSVLATPSCSKATYTRVYVRTDASTEEPRLFQSARLEVFRDGVACEACQRRVNVDARTFPGGVASFDIEGEGDVELRFVLYRERGGGLPRSASSLAVRARVALGRGDRYLDLPMAEVGKVIEAEALVAESPPPPLARSIPLPLQGCPAARRPNEACIPGGTFWMGDPQMDLPPVGELIDGKLERLVTLDAFAMEATEVTVGAFRKSGLATAAYPVRRSREGCLYPEDPNESSFDAYPVNCITHELAQKYCSSIDRDLPTEAEFEYVAGALRSQAFVWGEDPPKCGDAVLGFAGCKESAPLSVGSARRDRLTLPGQPILVDLTGNVHEFTRDRWNREDGPCWGLGHFYNPTCDREDVEFPTGRVVRGGAYAELPTYAPAALREFVDQPNRRVGTSVGLRCVLRSR